MDALGYIEEAALRCEELNEAAAGTDLPMPRGHMTVRPGGVLITVRVIDGGRAVLETHREVSFQTLRSALVNPLVHKIEHCLTEIGGEGPKEGEGFVTERPSG